MHVEGRANKIKTMARLLFLTSALLLSCLTTGSAQTGIAAFGVLDTVSHQNKNCSVTLENGLLVYQVDGATVDSIQYSECQKNHLLMTNCQPCWSKVYDEEGMLLYEAATYTDCFIGGYRSYYPSGKVKTRGQFRSQAVRDSTETILPGTCSIKTGDWVYYQEDGTIDYEEIWNNGQFLQQIPNQEKSEVWAIDLTFFGGKFAPETATLRFDMVNKLTIQPLYKNANRAAEVTGVIEISCANHPSKSSEFTPTSFPYLDLNSLLPKDNNWKREDLLVALKFYVDSNYFKSYALKVY
jgi:hypothetical protein